MNPFKIVLFCVGGALIGHGIALAGIDLWPSIAIITGVTFIAFAPNLHYGVRMTTKQYLTWGGLLCGAVVIILIALWGFTDVLTPAQAPSVTVPEPTE